MTIGLEDNVVPKKLDLVVTEDKGRGVIALEAIKKDDYVLEYKYSECYSKRERAAKEEEYSLNSEGCYILDAQLPQGKGWICLDATRNVNCWSRYINHSIKPNLKLFRPLMIRGKWRVGFVATRDIKEGEALSYDYGQQKKAPTWLKRRPHKVILFVFIDHSTLNGYCPPLHTHIRTHMHT